ncbi:hypothetical protein UFOVP180_37 [uncultured Caudovirales phage]|uniref:Uncharacterized protein n=1 Tax=uncultured Caudovirales phage TaxID=2100421 RepID=A0A6J7WDK9_9CAUD|nr:hypothetical protein UFOVP180_37 [uncultured Caudovirales phage]
MTAREQAEQDLTAALKMVVDALAELGFEDFYILGKVNLILQKFITDEGAFTEEYIQLAKQALDDRKPVGGSIIIS